MCSLAAILGKYSTAFESLTCTLWLFATVGVYTFGASVISDLFVALPCFDGAGESMMVFHLAQKSFSNSCCFGKVHDPSTKCYGDTSLVVLSIVGIVAYSATTAYVLGFAFWGRKNIIQVPSDHEESVVKSTYKAFGFLFYGM